MKKNSLLIVDDHRLFRDGLRLILRDAESLEIAGECNNGREALEFLQKQTVDIVLLDIAMPRLNGIETAHRIRQLNKATKILALSMHAEQQFVRNMFKAGVSGYMLKAGAAEELLTALQTIIAGNVYTSQKITNMVFEDYFARSGENCARGFDALSSREREVLQLIAEGNHTKAIASICGISPSTVDVHKKRVMDKLEIDNVADLTKFAIRQGIAFL